MAETAVAGWLAWPAFCDDAWEVMMDAFNDPKLMILLLLPLVLIQFSLLAVGVRDWLRRQRFRYLSRWVWLGVIVAVGIVGPLVYLLLGREDS